MVVRCSLIGHSYGETEIDRDREERGSEVVVTVVEYEVCSRCGTRSVLSENTEVTTKHTGETPVTDESVDAPSTAAGEEATPADTPSAADDATGDADDATAVADGAAMGFDEEAPPIPTDEDGEPITDDAEILDDEEDERTDRGHGEWPEAEDVGPPEGSADEPAAWPDDGSPDEASPDEESPGAEGGDVVDDPATADDEPIDTGEILTDDESAPVERSSDEIDAPGTESGDDGTADDDSMDLGDASAVDADPTPEGSGDAADSATHAASADADSADEPRTVPRSGIESAGEAPSPADSPRRSDVPTEFFCPRCSFVATEARASLRAGDICPECKRGYLGERDR